MGTKVAIIEDDAALAEMYRIKFESVGYEVVLASNGEEGLTVCQRARPKVILLDLMMPVMTGDEMLEKLRATDWGKDIRVLVLTNLSKDEAPAHLKSLNVDSYIVKAHYTPGQVVDIVQRVLGGEPKQQKK